LGKKQKSEPDENQVRIVKKAPMASGQSLKSGAGARSDDRTEGERKQDRK
jgi:hypothetical protein